MRSPRTPHGRRRRPGPGSAGRGRRMRGTHGARRRCPAALPDNGHRAPGAARWVRPGPPGVAVSAHDQRMGTGGGLRRTYRFRDGDQGPVPVAAPLHDPRLGTLSRAEHACRFRDGDHAAAARPRLVAQPLCCRPLPPAGPPLAEAAAARRCPRRLRFDDHAVAAQTSLFLAGPSRRRRPPAVCDGVNALRQWQWRRPRVRVGSSGVSRRPAQPVMSSCATTLVGVRRTRSSPGTPLRVPNASARSGPM